MIKKNATFSQLTDVTILEFGTGDILVSEGHGIENDYTAVMFKNQEPKGIGVEDDTWRGKTSDELQPDVIMIFTNPNSIDVIVDKLQKAKERL